MIQLVDILFNWVFGLSVVVVVVSFAPWVFIADDPRYGSGRLEKFLFKVTMVGLCGMIASYALLLVLGVYVNIQREGLEWFLR